MYTHTHTYSYIYITLFTILLSKGLNRAICLRFSQFTHEKFHWEILPKVSHIVISCSKINSKLTFENFYQMQPGLWPKIETRTCETWRQEPRMIVRGAVRCCVLQYAAVTHTCGTLQESFPIVQCVAVCCSVLQCVAVCCNVLQWVAVCCSVLLCVAVCCCEIHTRVTAMTPLQLSLVQCSAVRCCACSVAQCVAVKLIRVDSDTAPLHCQWGAVCFAV